MPRINNWNKGQKQKKSTLAHKATATRADGVRVRALHECQFRERAERVRPSKCMTYSHPTRPTKLVTCTLVLRARKRRAIRSYVLSCAAENETTIQAKKSLFQKSVLDLRAISRRSEYVTHTPTTTLTTCPEFCHVSCIGEWWSHHRMKC